MDNDQGALASRALDPVAAEVLAPEAELANVSENGSALEPAPLSDAGCELSLGAAGAAGASAGEPADALAPTPAAEPEPAPLTFEERVANLEHTVTRNSRFREIEYQTLGFCLERRSLREVEEFIASVPEFKTCGQNQYRLMIYLEDAGGLERFEVDEAGTIVTDEMKEGLTEDEIDDLVVDYAFVTTDEGRAVYEKMKPEKRMEDLMKVMPARSATYCEVLEFCQQPRSFKEIDSLLRGRDILKAGSRNPMTNIPLQPSVFVDNLERSGGIVWDGAWKITEGGRRYLEAVKQMAG